MFPLLTKAFAYEALARTADELEKLTKARPPMRVTKWTGKPWPVPYSLPAAEGSHPPTSLRKTLGAMTEGSVLAVCLLATYRSNGPYGDFLGRWLNFATWFTPFVQGLHVITMKPERNQDHEWIYGLESAIQSTGREFALLADEDRDAHMPLEPDRSPIILLLDRRGTIVYEGELDSVEWWETIAAVAGRG